MRLATIASAAVFILSSAALAQVAGVPVEQKGQPTDTAGPAKDADGTGAGAMPGTAADTVNEARTNAGTNEVTANRTDAAPSRARHRAPAAPSRRRGRAPE